MQMEKCEWVCIFFMTDIIVWPDLQKGFLYMHPVFKLSGYVTQLMSNVETWNLFVILNYHCITYVTVTKMLTINGVISPLKSRNATESI